MHANEVYKIVRSSMPLLLETSASDAPVGVGGMALRTLHQRWGPAGVGGGGGGGVWPSNCSFLRRFGGKLLEHFREVFRTLGVEAFCICAFPTLKPKQDAAERP